MSQRTKVLLSAAGISVAFFIVMQFDLLRKTGLLYCEGYGCTGLGLLYLVIGGAIPLVLMVGAGLICRHDRMDAAVTGFITGAICVGLAIGASALVENARIDRDVCATIKQCQEGDEEYRGLCSWQLEPSTRDQYPQCFNEYD